MGDYDYRWVTVSSGYGRHYSRSTVHTSPRKVFKSCYIVGYIFGLIMIFAVLGMGLGKYSDKEINAAQLRGLLLGVISNVAFLVLFVLSALLSRLFVPSDYIGALALTLVLLFIVMYIITLVVFCKCYKTG